MTTDNARYRTIVWADLGTISFDLHILKVPGSFVGFQDPMWFT